MEALAFSYPPLEIHTLVVRKNSSRGRPDLLDGVAHALLVVVGLGGVDGAVAHGDGVGNAAFTLGGVHLVHAVAQQGHLDTVGKGDVFHVDSSYCIWERWVIFFGCVTG